MSTKLAPTERTTGWGSDDDLDHTVCDCDENIALCGRDVTEEPWVEDGPNPCVVCRELNDLACERCGA